MTGLQWTEAETDLPVKQYVPNEGDPIGYTVIDRAIEEFEPDVIYMTGDPGSVTTWANFVPSRIPFFTYCPIEGEPIVLPEWQQVLKTVNFMTCSEYGQAVVKRDLGKDVGSVYHGVDTDVFKPLTDERRAELRAQLGWTDKFVVMTVAANVRRKQHPRLFEAIAILKYQYGMRDVVLYDHTVPFQNFWLEGWNLPIVSDAYGIHDEVVFNPLMTSFGKTISDESAAELPGLAELYGAADIFVLPSQVEGFGLPIAEAMATGLPVIVTKYGAGWEVAKLGDGVGIEPHDWETAKSGTRYANINPADIASAIARLRANKKRRASMRQAGLDAAKLFDWAAFKGALIEHVEATIAQGGIATDPEEVPPTA